MSSKVALIGCIIFAIWLLHIESKINPEASRTLWIPTFWLLIMASRPVGRWFDTTSVVSNAASGSVYDRFVLNILILFALWVLSMRKIDWSLILKDNFWLILLYMYLLCSILWSDYPFSSLKRWVKIFGAIPMAIVVLSERRPLQALESVLRRCAYGLIPLSLVLIKYFPDYGVTFDRWEGTRMGTGVTTHKNGLGVLCALLAFALIWAFFRKWRSGELLKSRFHTFADVFVVGIALFLLYGGGGTSSATSIFIFTVGIAFLLGLSRFKNLAGYTANHLKVLMIVGVVLFLLFSSLLLPTVTSLLGRDESLTGRSDIWSSVVEVASQNPIFGVGYGGYWGVVKGAYSLHHEVMQSHNGYLEVYLQVGIVGIVFLSTFLLEFWGKIQREYFHVVDWGVFGICFILMLLLYNYSEADFLEASFLWTITVFLTVVFSTPALTQTENEQRYKEQ